MKKHSRCIANNGVALGAGLCLSAGPMAVIALAAWSHDGAALQPGQPFDVWLALYAGPPILAVASVVAGVLMRPRTARREVRGLFVTEEDGERLPAIPWVEGVFLSPAFWVLPVCFALVDSKAFTFPLVAPLWYALSYLALLCGYCWRWLACRSQMYGLVIGSVLYGLGWIVFKIYANNAPRIPEGIALAVAAFQVWFLWPLCIAIPLWSCVRRAH